MADPKERLASIASDAVGAARMVARDLVTPLRGLGARARAVGGAGLASAARLRDATTTALRALPREALPELGKSLAALRKVRTPAQASEVVETETERLLTVVTPLLVAHPLPVERDASARAILASAGALAAAGEEAEALAALVSSGATVPVTLPVVIGANLVALSLEIYVAASLRVHDLEAAGLEADPQQVAADVIAAMTGSTTSSSSFGSRTVTRHVTKAMVKKVTARLLARWGAGFVPVAGVAYAGWDAQRTVAAVRALPLPEGPAASGRAVVTPTGPEPAGAGPAAYPLPS